MEELSVGRWFALLSAAAIAGCGSSSSSVAARPARARRASASALSASSTSARLASAGADRRRSSKLVPAAIKSKGTLTVAADASYAPDEFFASDGHTVIGMDADLSKALAAVMGLKANVVNATFDEDHPGPRRRQVRHGRVVVHRHQGAREDGRLRRLLPTPASRSSPRPRAGPAITSLADICGKTVAVEKGTTEETDATAQSAKCKKAGKPGVTVLDVPGPERRQPGALQRPGPARSSPTRRSPPTRSRSPTASSSSSAQTYGAAPYGLAIPKSNGLDTAVLAALKELMKNGTYQPILNKWGLQARRDHQPEDQRRDQLAQPSDYGSEVSTSELSRASAPDGPTRSRPSRCAVRGAGSPRSIVLLIAASIVRSIVDQPALRVARRRPVPVRRADPARRRR